jgi:hypothetical protein
MDKKFFGIIDSFTNKWLKNIDFRAHFSIVLQQM